MHKPDCVYFDFIRTDITSTEAIMRGPVGFVTPRQGGEAIESNNMEKDVIP